MYKWNNTECCWECENCGGYFSFSEVARFFNFNGVQNSETFDKDATWYCMDCGCKIESVEKIFIENPA